MILSSLSTDPSLRAAWRGQLAATGKRLGLRTYLVQHHQDLLPRFAAVYRQLRALPRQLRRQLQRQWRQSLAGIALGVVLGHGPAQAATTINVPAGDEAALVQASDLGRQ